MGRGGGVVRTLSLSMWGAVAEWLKHLTLNRENLVLNHLGAVLKLWQFRPSRVVTVHSAIKEYLATD